MGEHVKVMGERKKVGTCEDMMYVRREELERLPGGAKYLREGHFYRFPWPWEDDTSFEKRQRDPGLQMDDKHKAQNMAVKFERLPDPCEEYPHREMRIRIDGSSTAEGFNHKMPCPGSDDWDGEEHGGVSGANPKVHIHRRKYDKGQFYTVFKCGYCGMMFSLTSEDVEAFKNVLMDRYEKDGEEDGWEAYRKVADRLEAYTPEAQKTA